MISVYFVQNNLVTTPRENMNSGLHRNLPLDQTLGLEYERKEKPTKQKKPEIEVACLSFELENT